MSEVVSMDRALSSDRRDYSSERPPDHYRGGGYRRGGGWRGRGRGRRHDYHQPYNHHHRHHRGGGGGRSGNRFQADQQQARDPKQAAVRQLLQLLTQVGALQQQQQEEAPEDSSQRAVVAAQSKNIQALTAVLCGPQADIFLKHDDDDSRHADRKAGPWAAGVVHCQAVWPLQTPCYAALTLAVHEHATTSPYAGAGQRCIEYASKLFCRDLDLLLLSSSSSSSQKQDTSPPRTVVRLRLTLRYLALLVQVGMVQGHDDDSTGPVLAATHAQPLSLGGLLDAMAQAAVQAHNNNNNTNAACVLALLVCSTIPYAQSFLSVEWITAHLLLPLQELMETYQSSFAPGVGATAILLKAERHEDVGEENDNEEEEEEDDDDDDASNQVCDSLQDLLRSVQQSLKDDAAPCRFALFSDAPWKDLKAPETKQGDTPMEQDTPMEEEQQQDDDDATFLPGPLVYTGEPVRLQIFPVCKSLSLLMGGEVPANTELARLNLNGIIFGRLPFFGPPPEAVEDEEDEDMEEEGPVNERLQSYRTGYGMVDRFFLGQAVRDCLLSHQDHVTDSGVQHGSAKMVAEQIWSLRLLITGENANGLEYCILEVILSLMTQCGRGSPIRLLYLSRVLLELTRLEPAIIAPALALGVSTLFQDYMPALVPMASYNLSQWFAFHLTNTDYQWPAAYWKHWEPFVLYGWSNSRGAFVKGALALMLENLSNPELIVRECLFKESAIVDHLLPSISESTTDSEDASLSAMADEVRKRIWENGEDSESLLSHLVSDETGEVIAGATTDKIWARTAVLAKALMSPAGQAHRDILTALAAAKSEEDSPSMDTGAEEGDVLSSLMEKIEIYKSTLHGVMEKDMSLLKGGEAFGSDNDNRSLAELFLLEHVSRTSSYSRTVVEGCLHALLEHKLVQVPSVLKWSLGEPADGSTKGPALRWWELVTFALKSGVSEVLSDQTLKNDMAIDGGAAASSSTNSRVLNYLDPFLSYMIRRVSTMLLGSTTEKPNKLSSLQVDLAEGLKYVALECHNMHLSQSGRGSASSNALYDALAESAIAGPKLASLMDTDGSLSAEMLRQSLERL